MAKTITTKWPVMTDVPVYSCNHYLIQHSNNEFTLTLGYACPPAIIGPVTDEVLENIKDIPVRPIVRVGMTPERVLELIEVLRKNMESYVKDVKKSGVKPGGGYLQ